MYYISGTCDNGYYVKDTLDGVAEIYSTDTIKELIKQGIGIAGATEKSIKVIPESKVNQYYCGDLIKGAEYGILVKTIGSIKEDRFGRKAQQVQLSKPLQVYDSKELGVKHPEPIGALRYAYSQDGYLMSALCSADTEDNRFSIRPDRRGENVYCDIPDTSCLILNYEANIVPDFYSSNLMSVDKAGNKPIPIHSIVNVKHGYAYCYGRTLNVRGKGIYLFYYDSSAHYDSIESIYDKIKSGDLFFVNITITESTLELNCPQGYIRFDMNLIWSVFKKTVNREKKIASSRAKLVDGIDVQLYDNGSLHKVDVSATGRLIIPNGTVSVDVGAVQCHHRILNYLELPNTLKEVRDNCEVGYEFGLPSMSLTLNLQTTDYKVIGVIADRFFIGNTQDGFTYRPIIIDERSDINSAYLYACYGFWNRKGVVSANKLRDAMWSSWANMCNSMVMPDTSTRYKIMTTVVSKSLKDFNTAKMRVTLKTIWGSSNSVYDKVVSACKYDSKPLDDDLVHIIDSGQRELSIAEAIQRLTVGAVDSCDNPMLKSAFRTIASQAETYRSSLLDRAREMIERAVMLTARKKNKLTRYIDMAKDANTLAQSIREVNKK